MKHGIFMYFPLFFYSKKSLFSSITGNNLTTESLFESCEVVGLNDVP